MNKLSTKLVKSFYSVHTTPALKSFTIPDISSKYHKGVPLSMCTAYDYITANWVHKADCDMLLIGDSLGMTTLGYESTTELPFDEFKYHVKSVCRANGPSLIVADMPFGSFEQSHEYGLSNAIQIMKLSSKVASLKVEVGPYTKDKYTIDYIKKLCERGISVIGHIGLTPQRVNALGGFKVQANNSVQDIMDLYETAQKLQEIGCWSILIECVPQKVAKFITENVTIPTIGIGAGNGTSGQVLVISDLLGMQDSKIPKFVKKYNDLNGTVSNSIESYKRDIESNIFPDDSTHSFKIKGDIWDDFISHLNKQK